MVGTICHYPSAQSFRVPTQLFPKVTVLADSLKLDLGSRTCVLSNVVFGRIRCNRDLRGISYNVEALEAFRVRCRLGAAIITITRGFRPLHNRARPTFFFWQSHAVQRFALVLRNKVATCDYKKARYAKLFNALSYCFGSV